MTALPQYISADAEVKNAYITQGCVVAGSVQNSVLFTNVKVGAGAKVIDSVLMPGAVVEDGAVVTRALVADGVQIGKQAVVGSADSCLLYTSVLRKRGHILRVNSPAPVVQIQLILRVEQVHVGFPERIDRSDIFPVALALICVPALAIV